MWSAVLDSYVDDDDDGDAAGVGDPAIRSNGDARSASDAAAAASRNATASTDPAGFVTSDTGGTVKKEISALSGFESPPRRKRIDLLRLQMCCPTLVGAPLPSEADSTSTEKRVSAHTLFSFPPPLGKQSKTQQGSTRRPVGPLPHSLPASDHSASSSSSCSSITSTRADTDGEDFTSRHICGSWRAKAEVAGDESSLISADLKNSCTGDATTAQESTAGTRSHATRVETSGHRVPEDDVDAQGALAHTGESPENGGGKSSVAAGGMGSTTAQGSREKNKRVGDEVNNTPRGAGIVLEPDGVPLLVYEQGVFHVAEAAPMKEFGGRRKQMQQQNTGFQELRRAAAESGNEGCGRGGKALLRLLPKPQHRQHPALGPGVQGVQQQKGRDDGGGAADWSAEQPSFSFSARNAGSRREASGDVYASTSNSDSNNSSADGRTTRFHAKNTGNGGIATDVEDGESESDVLEEGRGSLFSLFSAYDDEPAENVQAKSDVKKEQSTVAATTTTGKRRRSAATKEDERSCVGTTKLPLLGIASDTKEEGMEEAAITTMSRIGVHFQQEELSGNSDAENKMSLSNAADTESATGTYTDIWGSNEPAESAAAALRSAAAQQGNSDSPHQNRVEGMSLNEYREMQHARVKDVSGEALRDPDWQMNYQLNATSAHAKKSKLHISTNVWSVKDKALVQTIEPRAMQKRKHQINWLAAEAAEKELEMWEMMAKTRQNKYNTSLKYGW